ncbi:JAB domain-containing protein [Aureitalea sp. L0-47]|uniref:JAB domain-containing protein n=1 Tax=Aureitalea sp. L0-47 TaxID=2816962 RepID=UPI002238927D|nr:JAB domain-containing protein [Aureitalea sp. L0-47]MCW5518482.1 JAB domain-containing protein [Aureitalea sp. L0-47]
MNTIREIKLSYSNNGMECITITDSQGAYKALLDNWNKDTIELQEEFKVLLLNRSNHVLGIYNLSKGGVSGTVVDAKLLLASALKANASSIIIAHNHPSGNLKPSANDNSLTKKIKQATKLCDITLLDHLIMTKEGFYSYSDESDL